MSKKVLVISTSLRVNSNSDALAAEFARGAAEAGNAVETVSLRGQQIAFCKGCLACLKLGECVIKDDAIAMAKKMGEADVIAFATPVYYYGMSGQMKTLLDRANSLYESGYQFRDIYLLAAAAEPEDEAVEGTEHGLKCWIACYEKVRLAGTVFCGGVDAPGTIRGNEALQRAYEAGKSV